MPQLLHDIDSVFPGLWVWWMFPVVSGILQYAPVKGIREFLSAPDRFKKVRGELQGLPPGSLSTRCQKKNSAPVNMLLTGLKYACIATPLGA